MLKKISIMLIFVGLSACSFLSNTEFDSNNKNRYLQSRNGNPLIISKPLSDANISDFYQLPDQDKPAKISISVPTVTHD